MIDAALMMVLLFQDPAAAPSAPPAAPPPAHAKAATPDPEEVICKRQPITGSRLIFEKTCRTRAEWEQSNRVTQQQVDNMTRSPVGVGPKG